MEANSSDEKQSSKLINCCSKQAVEAACNTVLASVCQHIDKSEYTDEFRENIKLRIKEIYKNAIHDNVLVEGQTWSQALEEGNTTKDYEPVNVELKKEITNKSLALDELLVATTRKRRLMPPKIAHEVAKRLKHQRHAVEHFSPVLHKLETDMENPPTKILEEESKQLQEAGETIGDLSRNLPLLENKASRLLEARELRSSMEASDVYRVIARPLTDEAQMASSMTPLRHRLANETPSPVAKPDAKYGSRALKVQNHPINNSYKLNSSTEEQ